MAGQHMLKDAGELLEAARKARIEMCVFPGDVKTEGEVATLARTLYLHVPELARREGHAIRDGEGHPDGITVRDEGLLRLISAGMQEARGVSSWLAAITSPQTKAMFAEGRDNAMWPALERFAGERGIVREDGLAVEARTFDTPHVAGAVMAAQANAMQMSRV